MFPDVFADLLTNPRYGTGQFFDAAQIDTNSFAAAADWTYDRRYFFDGAISKRSTYAAGALNARDFLLDLSISDGKFTLNPTVRFDEPEPVVAMFSSGNIIEDTLQVNYFDSQDRLDPIVSVCWREERRDSSVDSKGLFPQIREFNVRRKYQQDGVTTVSENAPVIQVDLSTSALTANTQKIAPSSNAKASATSPTPSALRLSHLKPACKQAASSNSASKRFTTTSHRTAPSATPAK